jgi:blue copper oxidase
MTSGARRRFLSSVSGFGIAAWIGQTLPMAGCGSSGADAGAGPSPAAPSTLRFPPSFGGGVLPAAPSVHEVWSGSTTPLWTLGGSYPSPTIRVRSGDFLDVRLQNGLPEATNIHWHGLVVPPEMDGFPTDLVLPGQARTYAFRVLQRAGTYWYHPHTDGRTGAQVYAGMAGLLIVEDDEETALGLPSGPFDVPLMIQDRRLTPDRSFAYRLTPMDRMTGYLGDTVLVNGTPEARLSVARGLYRFRLLNGSNARVYRLGFADGRRFQVIATDGGLLDRAVETGAVDLGPGERLELLVDFSPSAAGSTVVLRSLPLAGAGELTVLRLEVSSSPGHSAPAPSSLVRLERLDPSRAVRLRTFDFGMGMGMGMMGGVTINGRSFDPRRIDARVPRGETEIWEIRNVSQEFHPFHVHATQFQVLSRSGGAPLGPQDLGWKDTVLTWPGETVRIVLRFEQYPGLFVLHCHNLEHEDAGMMSAFEVT